MKKLFVGRHGETISHLKYWGVSDVPLSDIGKNTARQIRDSMKQRIPNLDLVFHSPQRRAEQTASIIAQSYNDITCIPDKRLQAKDYGSFTNKSKVWVSTQRTNYNSLHEKLLWTPPRGENYLTVLERLTNFVDHLSSLPQNEVLIITHEGIIKAFWCLQELTLTYLDSNFSYGTICDISTIFNNVPNMKQWVNSLQNSTINE